MKALRQLGILSALLVAFAGCGENGNKSKEIGVNPAEVAMGSGTYQLGSATVEGFDANGGRLETQVLQVVGEYIWKVKPLGGGNFQITSTGAAKFLSNNQVIAEFICRGARDVVKFKVNSSNAVSGLRVLESGCPQGFNVQAAQQMTVERISSDTFVFNYVETDGGARYFITFTFNKN